MSGGLAGARVVRFPGPTQPPMPDAANVAVEIVPGDDAPVLDEKGAVVRIEHPDGAVTVSLDGKPIQDAAANDAQMGWFDNLAEKIDSGVLAGIADDLLRGVEDDLTSRQEWIEDRAHGVKLLGLKIELPNVQGASDGAPVEGMSKVRHPLLLEAVLRFQANARSELLPTDGPVKIRNDSTSDTLPLDQLGQALETDLNHYLTAIATEYYPDTDRMLFMTGFGGSGFKKVYQCPLRQRPVSESVLAEDLIVNQEATDLGNAQRVTQRIMMRNSIVKRMQIMGHYRDIVLGDSMPRQPDALEEAKKDQQGIQDTSTLRPQDREREIYEVYCELDVAGFEHQHKGKASGLPVPYVVTIDKSSRECLAVVRNYADDGKDLPTAREIFVKYPFVPGMGFYDIGLLHILGNTTNAVTAAWREMLDNGMFANFPGFLQADNGARQNTNIFRVPPGGSALVKTSGGKIGDNVMPLPYTTQQMGPLMQLVGDMAETGRRIGGTAEVQVGEGRADVPVGTVMAMIDQAIKVMNAVHKRMHAAQAREFQLLKRVFQENPESFFQRGCKSKTPWDKQKFLAALNSCNLVPQADPNTSSQGQRIMKVMGLKQLQQASPNLYDPIKCDTAALGVMGWSNPDEFFVPVAARAKPPPQLIQAQTEMANDTKEADAKVTEANARATEAGARDKEATAKVATGHFAPKPEAAAAPPAEPEPVSPLEIAKAHATITDARTRRMQAVTQEKTQALDARRDAIEDQNRDEDRAARERDAAIGLAKGVIGDPEGTGIAGTRAIKIIDQVNKGLAGQKARKPRRPK